MADTPITAIEGKQIVYLYRLYSDHTTTDATSLAFQTENEHSIKADSDTTATKDGNIVSTKPVEEEITATSLFSTNSALIPKFKTAIRTGALVEIWEINLASPVTGKTNMYDAEYFQGKMTEMTLKSTAEDISEYDLTFSINGTGKSGQATISSSNQAVIDYVFADTAKTTS